MEQNTRFNKLMNTMKKEYPDSLPKVNTDDLLRSVRLDNHKQKTARFRFSFIPVPAAALSLIIMAVLLTTLLSPFKKNKNDLYLSVNITGSSAQIMEKRTDSIMRAPSPAPIEAEEEKNDQTRFQSRSGSGISVRI